MSNVCHSIFANYSESKDTEICKAWFRTAIEHCSSQLYFRSENVWLLEKLWLFGHRIFGSSNSISSRNIPKNPRYLSNNDCSKLYDSMANDYIDTVPQLNMCRRETNLLWSILMIMTLTIIVLFFWLWKLIRVPNATACRRVLNPNHVQIKTTTNTNVSIQRHLYEIRRLVVPKNCFLDIIDGPSMATFEYQSKINMCSVIAKLIQKSHINETVDPLHSNGRRCRIVFDFVYYHSDSDSDGDNIKATRPISRENTYIVENAKQMKSMSVKNRCQNRTDLLSESSTTSTINFNEVRINKSKPTRRRERLLGSSQSTRIPKPKLTHTIDNSDYSDRK